jgi:hypothetical protein
MPLILGANSVSGYTVKNSLRFNSGSSDTLTRTFASTGNRQIWTLSFWVKRSGALNARNSIINSLLDGNNYTEIFFAPDNTFQIDSYISSRQYRLITTQVFRDPSAWYHIVIALDTTQATSSNRVKMYVNGSQVTAFTTETYPTQNTNGYFNQNRLHTIGVNTFDTSGFLNGYLSEFNFIDGQALTPSSFGETNTASGIWIPKAYTGTYGTNGFFLKFLNSASLGTDSSGNGNTWTVNNLTSVDQSTDTPTNNFATLNPLYSSSGTGFTNGNLDYKNTVASWKSALSTIAVNKGKWYAEFKFIARDTASQDYGWVGICDVEQAETYSATWLGSAVTSGTGIAYGTQAGDIYGNNVSLATGTNPALNNIIGVAMDLDNNFVYFSLNGTFQNSGVPTSGASGTGGFSISTAVSKFYVFGTSSYDSSAFSASFGSPVFTIASGNTDGAGFGNFEYAVPSGYYSLNTKNLANFG